MMYNCMVLKVLPTGRPHGGCVFMYSKKLKFKIIHVYVDSRCCTVFCDFPNNIKILMFNIYMSCNTDYDQDNLVVYIDAFS